MTPDERKEKTMDLACVVRQQLKQVKIEANVYCHHYRNSRSMVNVRPKSKEAKRLNHWEYQALCKGLEYWLPIWIQNDKTKLPLFDAAKIYVG